MKFALTDEFEDSFEWNGRIYHVDMSFDNILNLFEMFDDDFILEYEKPFIAIDMLVIEGIEEFHSVVEVQELFRLLMKEFLGIDLSNSKENNQKVIDFKKDAEIIFASFFACYKIDLFEMKGKLHWKKFNALLNHLDDDSKFKKVIGYRTMKIPTDDHVSKEYKDHVIKMKELYSLDDRSAEERMNDAFDSISSIFKAKTKVVKYDG